MVRPKLVEEGSPIPQHDNDLDWHRNNLHHQHPYSHDNAALQEEYSEQANDDYDTRVNHHHHQNNDISSRNDGMTNSIYNTGGGGGGGSSLSSRNKSKSKSTYKLQTSIVIGSKKQHQQSTSHPNANTDIEYNDNDHRSSLMQHSLTKGSYRNHKNDYKLETNIQIGAGRGQNIDHHVDASNMMLDMDQNDDDVSMEIDANHPINIHHHNMHIMNNGVYNDMNSFTDNCHPSNQQEQEYQQTASTIPSRMEIDDTLAKSPLVVIDGPNIAYAYAQAQPSHESSSSSIEPNVRGIEIAASYFRNAGCRVQIVIPAYWMRRKPTQHNHHKDGRNGDNSNSLMMTEQVEILQQLQYQNLLLCSPPTDDDDAYVIAIARREDSRSQTRQPPNLLLQSSTSPPSSSSSLNHSLHHPLSTSADVMSISGAFILSNDLFRDAIQRDNSGTLRDWLRGKGQGGGPESTILPGRISYSFCDIGCMDLDFVANPR